MNLTSVLNWILAALVAACTVVGASSQLLAWAKQLTGLPTPADSKRKQRWFWVLAQWDVLARNSPMIRDQLLAMQAQRALAAKQRLLADQQMRISAQSLALAKQHAVISEQERNHQALLVSLKREAP